MLCIGEVGNFSKTPIIGEDGQLCKIVLMNGVTKGVAFDLRDFNVGMCRKLPKRKKAKIVSIN